MTQFTLEQALHLGIQQQQSGNLPQAESIYQQILAVDPDQPDAIHFLGTIAFQRGQFDQAISLIERSLALFPKAPPRTLPQLQSLRATLRPRMTASPLMNAVSFTQNIEAAYLQSWKKHCQK